VATLALETDLFHAAEAAIDAETAPDLVAVLGPAFEAIGFAYFSIVEAVRDGERFLLRPLLDQRNAAWVAAYDAVRCGPPAPSSAARSCATIRA
jgi:hypothetical protein